MTVQLCAFHMPSYLLLIIWLVLKSPAEAAAWSAFITIWDKQELANWLSLSPYVPAHYNFSKCLSAVLKREVWVKLPLLRRVEKREARHCGRLPDLSTSEWGSRHCLRVLHAPEGDHGNALWVRTVQAYHGTQTCFHVVTRNNVLWQSKNLGQMMNWKGHGKRDTTWAYPGPWGCLLASAKDVPQLQPLVECGSCFG